MLKRSAFGTVFGPLYKILNKCFISQLNDQKTTKSTCKTRIPQNIISISHMYFLNNEFSPE